MPTKNLSIRFQKKAVFVLFGLSIFGGCGRKDSFDHPAQIPRAGVTFTREIAPILFQNCTPCHRPGQSAPFSLLTFDDAKKHAKEIAKVTQERYMPPWLPEAGFGEFAGERRLTSKQIEQLQKWLIGGTIEGNSADLPQTPKYPEGWELGQPDLVVAMPEAYKLDGEGRDIYRNFVIPAPLDQRQFVRAMEFHPNNKSVHHVRILVDETRQSRVLDGQEAEPGFPGMNVPAKFPRGHMLTWTPGKLSTVEPDGLSWPLERGADIVLQIHMRRSGKPEFIKSAIGLYFTNQPPTKTPYQIGLLSQLIDIPAGERNYLVERSFNLPADVEVLAVMPHLHYLGKRVEAFAVLPDGTKQWLLLIKSWDFNWQSEYRYKRPVFLPKGSVVSMHYTFDNSSENVRNPNNPPQRVVFGPQSSDEMGEFWLQVIPRHPDELSILQEANKFFSFGETAAYYEHQLLSNPNDASSHFGLGKVLGPLNRLEEAMRQFEKAVELRPGYVDAHYYLGLSLYGFKRWTEASQEFETVLRLDPKHVRAHDGLGLVFLQLNDTNKAEMHFRTALEMNPDDRAARAQLQALGIVPKP